MGRLLASMPPLLAMCRSVGGSVAALPYWYGEFLVPCSSWTPPRFMCVSSSFQVATACFLDSLIGISVPGPAKASLCRSAEQRFAGVPCGAMDQYIAACAKKDTV